MPRLADFLGAWTLSRVIDDRRAGQAGAFEGRARFEPDGEGLRYREEGTLTLHGRAFPATRAYLWRAEGDAIAVRFADGRPFHRFRPEGRGAGTDHSCGADLYRVAYDFGRWPLWEAAWEVAGPAKDYGMRSRYARA